MERLRKFLALSWGDRCFLLAVALLLGGIRVGLVLLPFPWLWRILERLGRGAGASRAMAEDVGRIVGTVNVMGRYVPGVKCLERALAAKVLLSSAGHPVDLRIGVDRGQGVNLEAHAWLEDDGRIVIGNMEDLSRYTRLPVLELGNR